MITTKNPPAQNRSRSRERSPEKRLGSVGLAKHLENQKDPGCNLDFNQRMNAAQEVRRLGRDGF